jgi:hypothetical protein
MLEKLQQTIWLKQQKEKQNHIKTKIMFFSGSEFN